MQCPLAWLSCRDSRTESKARRIDSCSRVPLQTRKETQTRLQVSFRLVKRSIGSSEEMMQQLNRPSVRFEYSAFSEYLTIFDRLPISRSSSSSSSSTGFLTSGGLTSTGLTSTFLTGSTTTGGGGGAFTTGAGTTTGSALTTGGGGATTAIGTGGGATTAGG